MLYLQRGIQVSSKKGMATDYLIVIIYPGFFRFQHGMQQPV